MDVTLVLDADRGRGDSRQLGELRDRPRDRAARVCGGRRHGMAEQAAQPQAPRSRARVLREARRHGGDLEPLRADHPHVRAVRRRRGGDVGVEVSALQRGRRHVCGPRSASAQATRSATCRSSRTTSRWSRLASSPCRCCRWCWKSSRQDGPPKGGPRRAIVRGRLQPDLSSLREGGVQDVDDDVQVRIGEQERDAAYAVLELRR